jgi:large subunit ribosomal protein L21e
MKRSKGFDAGTRKLFKRSSREKGIRSLRYLLEPFEVGQKVDIILNSQSQKGRPHRRYHASTGSVIKKQGQAYVVNVVQGKRQAIIIARPEHLRLAK